MAPCPGPVARSGARPLFYALGALTSCDQVTASPVAKDLDIRLCRWTFEARGELDTAVLVGGAARRRLTRHRRPTPAPHGRAGRGQAAAVNPAARPASSGPHSVVDTSRRTSGTTSVANRVSTSCWRA